MYRLSLYIKPEIDFGIVLSTLEDIRSDCQEAHMEHIRFSLLELISNSIRAHRSGKIEDRIMVEFSLVRKIGQAAGSPGLRIMLEDRGGGFDPADLPYNIYGSVEDIDLQSEAFQIYREMHNQQRFGMGLLVTKRTFHSFRLEFIGLEGEVRSYAPDKIRGTRISLIHWGDGNE